MICFSYAKEQQPLSLLCTRILHSYALRCSVIVQYFGAEIDPDHDMVGTLKLQDWTMKDWTLTDWTMTDKCVGS